MDLKRGDIVVCVVSGDYGKPRPAVVIQSDLFNPTHASVTVCPVTSHLVATPLFRLEVLPTQKNGLLQQSQMMVDKMTTLPKEKIQQQIGSLTEKEIVMLDKAIKVWLGIE